MPIDDFGDKSSTFTGRPSKPPKGHPEPPDHPLDMRHETEPVDDEQFHGQQPLIRGSG